MTTVEKFTNYYLRRLWREGDQDLTDDLPNLVREAEARMSRDIRENSLVGEATLTAQPDENFFVLPADFSELISFNAGSEFPATLVTMDELFRISRVTAEGRSDVYAIQGNKIYVARGRRQDTFLDATIAYHMKMVPADMSDQQAEMEFYDLHPDFFLAALDVQVYAYLREYELSQEKNTTYNNLTETMIRQANYAKWPSGQLNPWKTVQHTAPARFKESDAPPPIGNDFVAIYEANKNG